MSKTLVMHHIIEEHILVIEIDNPPVNAISRQVRHELHHFLSHIKRSRFVNRVRRVDENN